MKRGVVFTTGGFLSLLFLSPAFAQVAAPLVGGSYFSSDTIAVAYIEGPVGACTGVLVGEKEVLTAAHCVAELGALNEIFITLGGQTFVPDAGYYEPSWRADLPTDQTIANDLGIYLLGSPVTNVQPIPVTSGIPPKKNDRLNVYGFGLTEDPYVYGYGYGRVAPIRVEWADGLDFGAFQNASGSYVCSGDSGGPVLSKSYGTSTVVGLTVAGTSGDYFGGCIAEGNTESVFLDLQSSIAETFLSYFTGVKRANPVYLAIHNFAETLSSSLTTTAGLSNVSKIKSNLKKNRAALKKNSYKGQGVRTTLLARVDTKLQKAGQQKKLSAVKKYIQAALADLATLAALPTL